MRTATSLRITALLGGLLVTTAVGAEGPIEVTSVEGITEYRYDNGFRVLLFPDPSKPQVTVNLTMFVGSRHEGYGEAGMAHLLEHMLFKGTPDHPQVPKVLKEHGAEFNGTTWLDRTNYFETLPASDGNLEFAIRLEADRMMNSYVKGEDLASEMTVVRNEFERGENQPMYILAQRMMAAAFEWHNYGKSTIGNRADIERVPIERLQEFYRKYYQPDNAMLIVAGSFEPEQALEYITKYFGSLPRPDRVLAETYTEEPAQDGERMVTLRRVGDVALAGAIYHIPSGAHPDYVSIDVLARILTAPSSGRLYKALVETKRSSSVSGSAYALHDPGLFEFMVDVIPGNDPRDVLTTMLEVIEGSGEQEVTAEEVERAVTYWLKEWELAFSDTTRIARQLSEWAAQGDWRLLFLYRDRLEGVTPASVQEVARRYLQQNNRTAGLFLPTSSAERIEVPATPELAAMIGDYQGRAGLSMGEAFEVSPANIESRTTRQELPSGLKVALLPKSTRGNSVQLRLVLRYGNADNLEGLTVACDTLPMLMMRGTKELDRQQILDKLDQLRAKLSPSGQAGEATFTLETREEFLEESLGLLRQILREASLPEEQFEIIRNQHVTALEQQLNDPQSLAQRHMSRTLNPYPPGDTRYIPTVEEEIADWKAASRAEIERVYREFLNGAHGELTIVGAFDPEQIQPQLAAMFADWKSGQDFARILRSGEVDLTAEKTVIQTPDKANAVYFAGTAIPLSDSDPDYPALLMGNYVLGSSGLASRLGDRVRQKEGLSYGVGSFLTTQSLNPRTTLYIYAITNPDNIEKVKVAIREELERLLADGITQAELDAARQGFLEKQKVELSDDGRLAATLNSTLEANRTMQFYADLDQKLNALTTEDVQRALQKWIDLERLPLAVAGDFQSKN